MSFLFPYISNNKPKNHADDSLAATMTDEEATMTDPWGLLIQKERLYSDEEEEEEQQQQANSQVRHSQHYAHGGGSGDDDDDDNRNKEVGATEENDDNAAEAKPKTPFWETPDAKKLKEDDNSKTSLQGLLQGSQRHEAARRAIQKLAEQFEVGMKAVLKEGIVDIVAEPILAERTSIFKKLEAKLEQSFQKNTQKRLEMHQRLDNYEEQWQGQYRVLTLRIYDKSPSSSVVVNKEQEEKLDNCIQQDGPDEKESSEQESTKADDESSPSKNSTALSSDELDWDVLLNQDHAPTVDRINRFLESRERLIAAQAKFTASYDEIRQKCADTTATIEDHAGSVYFTIRDAMDMEESDLQNFLLRNYQRRQDWSEAVEKTRKTATSFLASLMAKVEGAGTKRKRN